MPINCQPDCKAFLNFTSLANQKLQTNNSIYQHLTWCFCQVLSQNNETESAIPHWSDYNSITCQDDIKRTKTFMMPLLNAPAHKWNTIFTILKQAECITETVIGQNRKSIITLDMQLYEKAIKLQMYKTPELHNFLFRVGELHIVMNSLRALGKSIQESGLEDTWIEADLFSSTTVDQIIQCKNLKRTLNAHLVTLSALYMLYVPLVISYNTHIESDIGKIKMIVTSIN